MGRLGLCICYNVTLARLYSCMSPIVSSQWVQMWTCESISWGRTIRLPRLLIILICQWFFSLALPLLEEIEIVKDSFTHVIQMSHLMIYFHLGGLTWDPPDHTGVIRWGWVATYESKTRNYFRCDKNTTIKKQLSLSGNVQAHDTKQENIYHLVKTFFL